MTDLQLEACKLNALKSTGPRTEEGKKRSSMNACKHFLTAKTFIAMPEELAAFTAHCQEYHDFHKPVGKPELDSVQLIAELNWRIKRSLSFENSVFAQGQLDHAPTFNSGSEQVDSALAEGKTWVENHKCLTNMTLYETRSHRLLQQTMDKLEKLQAARKHAFNNAESEAIRQTELAESEGQEYNPGSDFEPAQAHGGFVFSAEAIKRKREFKLRSDRAWNLSRRL